MLIKQFLNTQVSLEITSVMMREYGLLRDEQDDQMNQLFLDTLGLSGNI